MKHNKYILVLITLLILIFSIKLISSLEKKQDETSLITKVQTETPIGPKPDFTNTQLAIDRFLSDPVFSPDGNFLVYTEGERMGGGWGIKLILTPQNGEYKIEGGDYSELGSWTAHEEDVLEYRSDFQAAWTGDEKQLAVLLPNGLFIRKFSVYDKKYTGVGYDFVKKVLSVVESDDDYSFRSKFPSGGAKLLNFSKDGQHLFVTTDKGLVQIWPDEKLIHDEEAAYYPLVNQDGFAYFREKKSYGDYDLVVLNNGKETVYATPIKGMDSASNILISPDLKHVCAEVGYSGHHGYIIFRLGSREAIVSGQQYSYCSRWLDNNKVLVKETPYFSQWTTEYFIINALTGSRQYLDYIRYND